MIDGSYALTGFVVGLTGVGGGALMTPILRLFFGVAPATAIAAATKLVVKRLWWGSLPTALLVVVISLGARVQKVDWLTQAIGLVVLITAADLLLTPKLQQAARTRRLGMPENQGHNPP